MPVGQGPAVVPPARMASILTLQVPHDLSDRECAEAVRCDLRWKVACGLALDDEGIDPSTPVYRRRRLAASGRPQRINDAVRKVIEETGVPAGRRRRAVDSTILTEAVHPGHGHPADRRDPPGGPGRSRPGQAGRSGMHWPRLRPAGQAEDRLG